MKEEKQRARPLSRDLVEQVYRVHAEITEHTKGHVFEDSTEIIRQMREERTQQLMEAIEGRFSEVDSEAQDG